MAIRHMEYGSEEILRAEVEKLTKAGYSLAESQETRRKDQFYYGHDIKSATGQFYNTLEVRNALGRKTSSAQPGERYILIWDSDQ